MFTTFVPYSIELFGAVLKDISPNMKKKKNAEFDFLKSGVIKPSKGLVSIFKEHFLGVAAFYLDSSN